MGKYREVLFDQEAQTRLLRGINRLTKAVSITLGPRGRNVILSKEFGGPKVVNDGVTIAQEQTYQDPFENMGAQLVKQVSKETEDAAGDGTTTATVLAHALITEGLKNITAGANPMMLKRGLDQAAQAVVDGLVKQSQELKDRREMARVATISSNDEEIGEIIADAMEAAGTDGVITVEESDSIDTTYEVVEGLQFDRGYLSPYFVTDAERMAAELKDPYILITDQKIKKARDLLPVLEKIAQAGKPLLVVAQDVEGEALTTMVINKLRGTLTAVAVKAPGFGDRRKAMLQDMAVLTGGLVIAEDAGMKIENTEMEQLGRAERVVVTDASSRSRSRWRRATPTTTARSSRSAWPSSPAAWRLLKSARPLRLNWRRRSTAWRTPSKPPRRLSRRAFSPAAAWRSSTRLGSWRSSSSTTSAGSAWRSCAKPWKLPCASSPRTPATRATWSSKRPRPSILGTASTWSPRPTST